MEIFECKVTLKLHFPDVKVVLALEREEPAQCKKKWGTGLRKV
jgi:hypothetical protein